MLKLVWALILAMALKSAQGQWRNGGGGDVGRPERPDRNGGWRFTTTPMPQTIPTVLTTVGPQTTPALTPQMIAQSPYPYFGHGRRGRKFGHFRRYPFYEFDQTSNEMLSDSEELDDDAFNENFEKCGCSRNHPQTAFCDADFVITGIPVQKIRLGPFTVMYRVNIGNKLKINPSAQDALQRGVVRIYTDRTECSAKMKKYTQYFIAGSMNREVPFITICNFVKPSSNLTALQTEGFLGKYKEQCDKCSIHGCNTNYSCKRTPPKDVCLIDGRKEPSCHDGYGICTKTGTNCEWNTNLDLKNCLDNQK